MEKRVSGWGKISRFPQPSVSSTGLRITLFASMPASGEVAGSSGGSSGGLLARRGPRQVRGGGAVASMSSGDSNKVIFCAPRTLLGAAMKLRGAAKNTQHSQQPEHTDNRQDTEHTQHQHGPHTHIACSMHTTYSTT